MKPFMGLFVILSHIARQDASISLKYMYIFWTKVHDTLPTVIDLLSSCWNNEDQSQEETGLFQPPFHFIASLEPPHYIPFRLSRDGSFTIKKKWTR